ncbi:MAG: CYTH domain-containing protein [Clostridia bacterium]|nr:CYTH domain-containing protein [Clostridia bacterium]
MKNSEYELKLMLEKDEYEHLLDYKVSETVQTNYYFDNYVLDVYHHKLSLRIREKNGQYELTSKSKKNKSIHEGIIMMEENNQSISPEEFSSIMKNERNISEFLHCEFSQLKCIGSLKTLRTNLKLDENLPQAELDMNEYNNIKDYELEWEIEKEMYPEVIEILKSLGITLENREVGKSKFVRFIKSLQNVD